MKVELHIPKNLQEPFDRLMDLVPSPYQDDKHVHQIILEYLELKGENYVRDGIKHTRRNYYSKLREKTLEKTN
ncbi:MAG: hypothetical protein BV456_07005 [Thermoplasmata archaeon M8B2D]|nr:MAG: hypothetical protein BV456_07005 [Thermoplasmata archaeon M8B2D]